MESAIYLLLRDHRAHTHSVEVGWRVALDFSYEVEGDLIWAYHVDIRRMVTWAGLQDWKKSLPMAVIDIRGDAGDNPFAEHAVLSRVEYLASQYPPTLFPDPTMSFPSGKDSTTSRRDKVMWSLEDGAKLSRLSRIEVERQEAAARRMGHVRGAPAVRLAIDSRDGQGSVADRIRQKIMDGLNSLRGEDSGGKQDI